MALLSWTLDPGPALMPRPGKVALPTGPLFRCAASCWISPFARPSICLLGIYILSIYRGSLIDIGKSGDCGLVKSTSGPSFFLAIPTITIGLTSGPASRRTGGARDPERGRYGKMCTPLRV